VALFVACQTNTNKKSSILFSYILLYS